MDLAKRKDFLIEVYGLKMSINVEEGDTLYYESVAHELDQRMRVNAETRTADTSKLAIFTALFILDELNQVKDSKDDSGIVIEKKVDELLSLIDTRLI